MKKLITVVLFIVFTVNLGFSQTKDDKKALKKEASEKEYAEMQNLINSGVFMFDGEWATSQRGRRVSLISNPTFIKMDAKEADAFLPFFGTSQNANYGGNGGIEFKGKVENYQVTFNDKKQNATIKFTSKSDKSENFTVSIIVFGGLRATVSVISSNRSHMSYSGKVKVLEKKEEEN